MAQFTVNAQRFDPYKNFKFRVKWDGRYVAGVSKVGALKRTTEVVEHREGGDPSTSRKSPGPHQVRGDHARARRHPRHRVREVGQQGLELRLRPGRGSLAEGLPQGHHHRGVQRGRPAGDSYRCSAAGCRSSRRCPISTPTPTPWRSNRSSSRTKAGSAISTWPSQPSRPSPSRSDDRRSAPGAAAGSERARWQSASHRPGIAYLEPGTAWHRQRLPHTCRSPNATGSCSNCAAPSSAMRSPARCNARSAARCWSLR